MHTTRKVKLKDLSPNLTCNLCGGYFIDATTIIECLHSFCRSCIVQHLEKSEYCPVCEVQLHSSNPLSSIRSDQMLQEVVYKLVPGLFQTEMSQRRKFYHEHSEAKPKTQQDGGQVFNESYISSEDMIHLSLEFDTMDKNLRASTKRFILCPAAVSIAILKKLIQGKYDLKSTGAIDIMYGERYLPDDFLLMDIAYKYSWSQNGSGPLQLDYRVRGVQIAHPQFKCKSERREPLSEKTRPRNGQKLKTEPKLNTPLRKCIKLEKSLPIKSGGIPTGKPRGRPKGKRSISVEDSPIEVKKVKPEKTPRKSKPTKLEKQKAVDYEMAQATEVQLRISENGIISAKSVSSGEEKIINPQKSPSPSSLNGNCPSPTGFPRKSITTNGNHTNSFNSSSLDEDIQDLPISLVKPKAEKRKYKKVIDTTSEKQKTVHKGKTELIADEKLKNISPPTMLKVPSPNKWLHQSNAVNGNLKFTTTKASPMKPIPSAASPSKKPPKFFKSRISESNGRSNGHNHTDADTPKVDLKVPVSTPHKSPTYENGSTGKYPPYPGHNTHKKWSEQPVAPEPAAVTQEQMNQFLRGIMYPLHVESNMNMGSMGLPIHFAPTVTNGYCSLPFFPNPNPFLTSALGTTMNLNPSFSPFSYANTNPTLNSSNGNKSMKGNGKNASLDLSLPSKKSKGYIQISPKKSQVDSKCKKMKESVPSSPTAVTVSKNESTVSKMASPVKSPEKITDVAATTKTTVPTGEVKLETGTQNVATEIETANGGHSGTTEEIKVNGNESLHSEETVTSASVFESVTSEKSTPPATIESPVEKGVKSELTPPRDSSVEDPRPTVLATLTVTLDEAKDTSPPRPTTVPGKSPTTTINNNNIVNSSDPPESSVSVNVISSSTTATSSA